jgi:hypothetical protein
MRRRCPPLHRRRRIFWDPDRFGVIEGSGSVAHVLVESHASLPLLDHGSPPPLGSSSHSGP